MLDQFKRAMDIIRRTGDKLMVFDSAQPDAVFMVMDLDKYEDLLLSKTDKKTLTEEELIDKINRDVALWRAEQESVIQKDIEINESIGSEPNISQKKSHWAIPEDVKQAAEEVVEEEKKYEEITF